jgi:hypothetical protein
MIQQLGVFTSEVTRVAREVGTEGKLGGQAQVPGAAGTWKDLTGNVNLLAANLTNQVRAIAEVAELKDNTSQGGRPRLYARSHYSWLRSYAYCGSSPFSSGAAFEPD